MTEGPWLSEQQQAVWRQWLRVGAELPAALHRGLQAGSPLSLPDFEVLVQLSEDPGGRLRVGDLAAGLAWERSRVSHHLRRMESRGLVSREDCPDDGRGSFVLVTEAGRDAIRQAAPAHARLVRSLVFDGLTPQQLELLDAVTAGILRRLDEQV